MMLNMRCSYFPLLIGRPCVKNTSGWYKENITPICVFEVLGKYLDLLMNVTPAFVLLTDSFGKAVFLFPAIDLKIM